MKVIKMQYVGIDLHQKWMQVCRINSDKRISPKYSRHNLTSKGFAELLRTLACDDVIAVEATGNSDFFKEKVKGSGALVVKVNTRAFKLIRSSLKKTDKNDAFCLAHYLQSGILPESREKSQLEQAVAQLCLARERVVRKRTEALNSIHGIFNGRGMKLAKDGLSSKKKLQQLDLSVFEDTTDVWRVDFHRSQVLGHYEELRVLEGKIIELAERLPGYREITSIKGIGPISAAIILSTIGNISDFKNKKKLCAYLGLVPSVFQSSETTHHGPITKRGSRIARKVLIQCAMVAKKYSPYLADFHARIAAKRGSGRAIVATARKLADIIYDTLNEGWVFTDFPNFVKN